MAIFRNILNKMRITKAHHTKTADNSTQSMCVQWWQSLFESQSHHKIQQCALCQTVLVDDKTYASARITHQVECLLSVVDSQGKQCLPPSKKFSVLLIEELVERIGGILALAMKNLSKSSTVSSATLVWCQPLLVMACCHGRTTLQEVFSQTQLAEILEKISCGVQSQPSNADMSKAWELFELLHELHREDSAKFQSVFYSWQLHTLNSFFQQRPANSLSIDLCDDTSSEQVESPSERRLPGEAIALCGSVAQNTRWPSNGWTFPCYKCFAPTSTKFVPEKGPCLYLCNKCQRVLKGKTPESHIYVRTIRKTYNTTSWEF